MTYGKLAYTGLGTVSATCATVLFGDGDDVAGVAATFAAVWLVVGLTSLVVGLRRRDRYRAP